MHRIYTHAQSELENTVGHIGDEFKEWGTNADECREELRGWHDRLATLEVRTASCAPHCALCCGHQRLRRRVWWLASD